MLRLNWADYRDYFNDRSKHVKMNRSIRGVLITAGCLLPAIAIAQTGVSAAATGLQAVLDQLYTDMLPQSSQLIDTGRLLAAFGALLFIGIRVLKHIARAEEIDILPLLRPFVIGMVIALYPYLIALLNGVLSPTVTGTAQMQKNANDAIQVMLQQKQDALKGTADYQLYGTNDGAGNEALWEAMNPDISLNPALQITAPFLFSISKAYYNTKNQIKVWLSGILELIFEGAALCINTLRTFNLIVLAVLGPIVLGLSVFPTFGSSLQGWLARYVNVYLWLPVANLFAAILGNIQVNMLKLDIDQIQQTGSTFFSSTDVGYLLFLVIGIAGYFSVPSIASYIVQAASNDALAGTINRSIRTVTGNLVRLITK